MNSKLFNLSLINCGYSAVKQFANDILNYTSRHLSIEIHCNILQSVSASAQLAARYRNATACARDTVASGSKVVAAVPLVTPFSTAQATALA